MNVWGHLGTFGLFRKIISSNDLGRGSLSIAVQKRLVYEPTNLREGFGGYFGKY
jgi:hypothetical protein